MEKMMKVKTLIVVVVAMHWISPAFADHFTGTPIASGPGLGTPLLSPAPDPGESNWFVGTVIFGHADWIDLEFETVSSAESQVMTLQMVLMNSSGTAFDAFGLSLDGPAQFLFLDELPTTSLLPLGGPPSATTPSIITFENPTWPGNADVNTVTFNVALEANGQADPVTLRIGPIPEPGSGLILVAGALVATKRRRS